MPITIRELVDDPSAGGLPRRGGTIAGFCGLLICCVSIAGADQETPNRIIDDFSGGQKAARAAWRPMTGSREVTVVEIGGRRALKMPCNFRGAKIDRASWDRSLKLDMTGCRGVQFLFRSRDVSPVAHFTMYFRSGTGWYNVGFEPPGSPGWGLVKVYKKNARVEGVPRGWGKVDTIRISAWRGSETDTEFHVAELAMFGTGGKIGIVRGDSAAAKMPGEARAARQYAGITAGMLDRLGLPYTVLGDSDVSPKRLKKMKLVILPYNPVVPDSVTKALQAYMGGGGKIIACYVLPKRLQETACIRVGRRVPEKYKGYFASIRPDRAGGLPDVVRQASWNIRETSAVEGKSRIVARWYTDKGVSTGLAAVVVSDNCAFVTHVLLGDDPGRKQRLLLAMAGRLVPELLGDAARGAVEQTGRFEPYQSYEAARRGISAAAPAGSPAAADLKRAERLRKRAVGLLIAGKHMQSIEASAEARLALINAHCLAQKSPAGEHRAFWCHSAFGVAGMTWDRAIKTLADNGFNAILPNMLWGGVAYYKSGVLPVHPQVAEKGDQVALCAAACRKYGVACHVWKVNYNMGWATPRPFAEKMKSAGRTQVDHNGRPIARWLCPSHPDNQKLEIDSMIEVARNYDIDGLHFDYIRYPGLQGCFCGGCRSRFEKGIDRRVANWPADVRRDGDLRAKWLDFRREQITAVVAAVAKGARKIRPKIRISAAVFKNWPADRDRIGQDWKAWCDRGYLDFVCPMDYTPHTGSFRQAVARQVKWAANVPVCPGIGLSTWGDPTDVCKVIAQINAARRAGAKGFTIFNYGPAEAADVLPMLSRGITRKGNRR